MPRVTVLMSVWNGRRYLRESIESILRQTYADFEFLIINDGSTDTSQSIIDSYSDDRVISITQDNIGLTRSLNRGLRLAKGIYVARLDADDFSLPERLSRQVAFLDANPHVGAAGSAVLIVNEAGATLRQVHYPASHDEITQQLFRMVNPIVHSSVMLRREYCLAVGGYCDLFAKSQDYDLYLRLSEQFNLANLSEVLCGKRVLCESMSLSGSPQLAYCSFAHALALLRQRSRDIDLSAQDRERLLQAYLEWCKESRFGAHLQSMVLRQKTQIKLSERQYLRASQLMWRATRLDYTWPLRLLGIPLTRSEHIEFLGRALDKIGPA